MRTFLILAVAFALPMGTGCGDDSTPTIDSGSDTATADTATGDTGGDDTGTDAPVADAPVADAPMDDAPTADAPMDDAATDAPTADAPADDAPADRCDAIQLGDRCEGADSCGSEYRCDSDFGRCVTGGDRPLCLGFAVAMCPDEGFTECVINSGASGGPCLTPLEAMCVCRDHGDFYNCASITD